MLIRNAARKLAVVNDKCMKKSRLILYWFILVLSMVLYYLTLDSLYSHRQINVHAGEMLGVQLTAILIVPPIPILGFVRLWLLKPVNQRQRLFDVLYFVIPVIIIIACFAAWIWVGITLSALAGILVGYEFIMSIIKMDSMLRKNVVEV